MDKHQLLTDEELAMLRDLGNDEDIATSQYPRHPAPSSPKPVAAGQALTLEARIAGYQLRFPLPLHPGRGGPRRAASPRRPLPSWVRPICAPGDSTKGRALHRRRGVRGIQPLPWRSHRGRLAGRLCQGEIHLADTFASGSPRAAMTGTLVRHVDANPIAMTGPSSSGWARRIRNNCGTGSSSATRTPSSRPIRVTKDNRAWLPCLFPRRSIRDRQLPGSRTPHRHPAS